MDMNEFWSRYLRRAKYETEEEKKEMLKELEFQSFIDAGKEEDFYNHLNRIMASFSSFSREKVLSSYKQGRKMGAINTLGNTQRAMLNQEEFLEDFKSKGIDSTEGPSSGDDEGFEDSFVDIELVNASEEYREKYGE